MFTLVLLPGLDGTGRAFADFVAALGPAVNTIKVCYPPDIALSYQELENVVRCALPEDRPFFLLAESFSGPIAIAIAASSPPGLRGLILCCTFARTPRPLLARFHSLLGAVPMAAVPMSLLGFFLLGRYSTPVSRTMLAELIHQVRPDTLRHRARAALTVDVSERLGKIPVPTLYLRARDDRVIPTVASALILERVPEVQRVEFAAPHFLLQVLPTETAATVRAFMESQALASH